MAKTMNTVLELIEDIRNGKMVILVDDEERENEGDLVLSADHVNPAAINFMATQARGLICLSLTSNQIDRLQLPQMVREDMNYSPNKTAFTVSIEASSGVTTGISAADRAHTIRVASNVNAQPQDISCPGHIFPIRAQQGGVLKRAGHTEGSIDLCRLAGLNSAAVICEVMNEDGTMARVPDLHKFAQKHGLKIGTIVDLIKYRLQNEILVHEIHAGPLPSFFGYDWKARVFKSQVDSFEHIVLQKGDLDPEKPILTRVHVDHTLKDVFNFLFNRESHLYQSIDLINKEGSGAVILLRPNPRPSVVSELKNFEARTLEEWTHGSFMDERDYGIGAQILRELGVKQLRLISNRHDRRVGLKAFGLEIVDYVPVGSSVEKGDGSEKRPALENRSGYSSLQ